jgi:LydA holin phage, holin superfamily III
VHDGFTWWHGLISLLGGAASFRSIFSWEDSWKKTVVKFISHLTTSFFAGMVAFYLCQAASASTPWTLAVMGLMAWSGSRGLEVMYGKMEKWFGDPGTGK